jgi:hypothetical protein
VGNINVTCLLGKISSPSNGVEVDVSKAAPNSTRWIFDVAQDTSTQQALDFQLLDNRSGKPKKSGFVSLDFTPRNAEATQARLHAPHINNSSFTIQADNIEKTILYRVTINAIHSLER